MLSIFPTHFLALFAYFILRLFVGGIVLYFGITHLKHRKELSTLLSIPFWPFPTLNTTLLITTEIVIAISLILGAYTQLGALLLITLCIKMLFFKKKWQHHSLPSGSTCVLLLGCAISLFITGAGVLAFDLPI